MKLSLDRLGVLNRAHLQRRVADETQRPQLVRDLRAILQEKHKARWVTMATASTENKGPHYQQQVFLGCTQLKTQNDAYHKIPG